jgi:putative peptidoglycan lipid II flippase
MTDTESKSETTADQSRNAVMQAAGLIAAAVLLSRLVGLLRDMVTRYFLGVTSLEATAFDAASRFPETIFLIIAGGAIGSAFIPTFAGYFARGDETGAWRLFSAVVNLVTLITTLVAGITILFAPHLVTLFLPTLVAEQPELLPLTVRLMRVMLISPVIFGVSGVVMAALNARQHFLLPALAPTLYNLGIIAGAFLVRPPEMGLAVGTVGGALAHLLVQLPGLRHNRGRYTAVLTMDDPGVRQVLRLMAPRVLGLSFSEVNRFITLFLSGLMQQGSLPALTLAWRVMIMPQAILGQALGIAAFPTMAILAARGALAEMRYILADALRMILFLGLPATILLALLREPVIVILFQRGVFSADDTNLVTWALLFYAIGLVALTLLEVIARAFYALNDTMTPVLAGGAQLLMMAALSVWLSLWLFPGRGWLPLGGLALGHTLSNFFEVGLLLWLLRGRLGGINGRTILDGLWRMTVSSLVMGSAIWLVTGALGSASVWWRLIAGGSVGAIVYLVASIVLKVEEVRRLVAFGRGRLAQRSEG